MTSKGIVDRFDNRFATAYSNQLALYSVGDPSLEPIDKLSLLSSKQTLGTCIPLSYSGMLQSYADPKNPIRSWLYQTCTEWGFYMTCLEGSGCPYTQGLHTLQVDYDVCFAAFGVTPEQIQSQVRIPRYVRLLVFLNDFKIDISFILFYRYPTQ